MKKSPIIVMVFVFLFIALPLKTLDTWMAADIRLDTGDTAGASNSQYPQIACSGNYVYAVWNDERNGVADDIYFNYSTDGSLNWQPAAIRLDTGDTAGANTSTAPQIACSGDNVYVVWHDFRNSDTDIYFNYSTDNGVNWQPSDIRLDTGDTAGTSSSLYPQITCSGNHVYVVWQDYRNVGCDIYFNYSSNGGASWQTSAIRLDTGDTPGASNSFSPQIACSENSVYVVWNDVRIGNFYIYYNYSLDNGANWQSPDMRLDSSDSYCDFPQIVCSGNNIYAAWGDRRHGAYDIYFNYSIDSGLNWQSSDTRLDTGDTAGINPSWYPQIACSGNNVYVVWYDERNSNEDIYFNYSNDNGATWPSSDMRLDTGDAAGANDSFDPQIACSGNNVYVVWWDNRNGLADIYFNYSTDNGANWQSSDIRLDTGDTAGANYSYYPQITSTNSDVYAVWQDYRNGSTDIYFNRAIPQIDIKANGSDGPISIAQSDTLQIRVSLTSYGLGADVDYWLAYKGPSGWIHYNYSTKKWESGLGVTHQGPLMDLNNKKVFQSKLSPGNYTFYFGVDMVMNGKVTKSSLYKDEVKVTVTSN